MTIWSNTELSKNLDILKQEGYNYIIKAQDKIFSYWGLSQNKKHIQLIACKTEKEKDIILKDLYNDKSFNYVNWCYLKDKKTIYNYTKDKTFTIRNDWTRAFK